MKFKPILVQKKLLLVALNILDNNITINQKMPLILEKMNLILVVLWIVSNTDLNNLQMIEIPQLTIILKK